ncbi:hypothetical protein L1987_46162 [Smallanthus sonchifolius]|uniref:Uncharacterized protein n=1 Tax=Smallanthus sonchifolius TaxID=185202 RepID=A0ACB9FZL9_9ASTR|nr:hypothetical protein L1987_46162 [Smallanthus sonchifolius]
MIARHLQVGKKRKEREEQSMSDVDVDLTEEHITVVSQMGFASIQHFNVVHISSCFGLWLLKKYDHNTNTFNMGNRVVNIARELVNDVLGIPMGSKEVAEMKRVSYKNAVVAKWRNQFGVGSPLKKVNEVVDIIKSSGDNGRMFQLNFMVVYNTVMYQITKMNTVNMQFLPSLLPGAEVKDFDWCIYTIKCLERTKSSWSELEADLIVDGGSGFLSYLKSKKENSMANNDVDVVATMEGVEHQAVYERENVKENGADEVDLFNDDINNEAFEQDVGI